RQELLLGDPLSLRVRLSRGSSFGFSTDPHEGLPPQICLKISHYLMKEARGSLSGMPVVFSLVGLLDDSSKIERLQSESDGSQIPGEGPESGRDSSKSSREDRFSSSQNKDLLGTNRRLKQRFQDNPRAEDDPMLVTDKACPPGRKKTASYPSSYAGSSVHFRRLAKQVWQGALQRDCHSARRISAIGVAERIGNLVGYSIRLETKASKHTRLLFCTTGILLRRLEADAQLKDVTHVLVDEVHERSEESDFLLLILKDLLVKRKDLKIILMSATLNAGLFVNYFANVLPLPPVVDIPGRTFPVKQLFLEEVIEVTGYTLELGSSFARPEERGKDYTEYNDGDKWQLEALILSWTLPPYPRRTKFGHSARVCSTLSKMNFKQIDYDLIQASLEYITGSSFPNEGSILIFLPGMAEISNLYDQLSSHPKFGKKAGKFRLLPLHGFYIRGPSARCPEGRHIHQHCRDLHHHRGLRLRNRLWANERKAVRSSKNMESLESVWRKGRAGRVRPGVCLHLYSSFRYEAHFYKDPRKLEDVLMRMLEPPSPTGTESAKERLKSVSALDAKGNLTPLGYHLANLPVDVKIGKLLILGSVFRCLDSALTIAAALSYRSPFTSSFGQREELKKKRREFSDAYRLSDQLTDLKAYKQWREVCKTSRGRGGYAFAKENMLSFKTLQTLVSMKHQFAESLVDIGFISEKLTSRRLDHLSRSSGGGADVLLDVTSPLANANNDNGKLILSVLCGALYPNVVQVLSPEIKFKQTAGGAMHKPHSAEEVKLKAKGNEGFVVVHPSSVVHGSGTFSGSSYLMYHEKVKTSR
ncbi:DEAH (AspGluAlaAsp/His) box polypeptide 57, partial [Caligus rogercresseyi]